MKFAGYILAFYLILLAAIPCCSFDDCPDDKMEQSTNHQNGDEDCGNCSPFFSCDGCATATENSLLVSFQLESLSTPKPSTEFIQPYLLDVHYDFWQPPQLS